MDRYFLVLLGTGLKDETLDHCYNAELQKGLDIVTTQILQARNESNCRSEGSYLEDPLLSLIQGSHHVYLALNCSQQLQLELQEADPEHKPYDIFNSSDWYPGDEDAISQTQSSIRMLVSKQQDNNNGVLKQNVTTVNNYDASPSDDDDDDDDDDDGDDGDFADQIHHLADLLPTNGGAIINVYWILPDINNLDTRNTLPLFGALKRLQQCNSALLNILTTNKLPSDGFLDSWKKWLSFNVLDMTHPLVLRDVPLWHGSLTCVGLQRKSSVVLPGFTLTSNTNPHRELDLIFEKSDGFCSRSSCEAPHLKPEIQILRYIPRISVPLYLLLPIKLKLHLEYKNEKLSQTFLEDLQSSCSKGLGLLACMALTTKAEAEKTGQNLESWMEYITSSSHLSTSSDVSPGHPVSSGLIGQSSPDVKRLCLISCEEPNDISVYLFRQPNSLNGKVYEYLQTMTRGKKIIDYETDSKLRVQDLSDSFYNTEREMSSLYTKEVVTQIEKLNDSEIGIPSQKLQEILSLSASEIMLPQRKSLHRTKKIDIELSSSIEHSLQSDLNVPPSKWPERLWLMQNDPAELAAREAKKKAPIPIEEVLSMNVKDILKRFHSDGRPVKENLSPLRSAYKTEADSYILINTTEESIRQAGYPEALTKQFHGVEYCLDSRDALSKDIQLSGTQTSILKQETLSSYAALNSKRLETIPRNVQRVTRSKDKNRSVETVGDAKITNPPKRSKKRASPPAKQDTKRRSTKRRRSESPKQEEEDGPSKTKESRSQRHKRRLRLVVEKTLAERGINKNSDLHSSCSERLYSLIKSFLKDLKSSHGLNDTMKELALSNVDQVINFEKTRLKVK